MMVIREVYENQTHPSPPFFPGLLNMPLNLFWEGTLILIVIVNKDGFVRKAKVEKSTGFQTLDITSLQTIKKWFFIPAKKGKKNLKDTIKIPVRFILN